MHVCWTGRAERQAVSTATAVVCGGWWGSTWGSRYSMCSTWPTWDSCLVALMTRMLGSNYRLLVYYNSYYMHVTYCCDSAISIIVSIIT